MYRRVLHEHLNFRDDTYMDSDTRALMRGVCDMTAYEVDADWLYLQLLQKDPELRMTIKRVRKAKYFEAIDWE